jgi:GH24 family phage-related lysozyme (muramidase)
MLIAGARLRTLRKHYIDRSLNQNDYNLILNASLRDAEINAILVVQVNTAIASLISIFTAPYWNTFSGDRQMALIDMIFNMGAPRFKGFKKMIAAIKSGDWYAAGIEAKNSLWYT